jgi:ABC-type nitrate/sulfonate/bicarbonate transport system substrate-binding protein
MTVRFRILARALVAARSLAALCSMLLLIAVAATPARAQGKIEQPTLEIAAVRDPQLGPQVAIADALGYFKDAGIS